MWPPETSFPKILLEFKSPTPTCSMCLALANCATSPKSFQGEKKHPPERAKKNCHASVHTWEATGCVRTEERPRAVSRSRSWPHVRCLDSCREFAACSFRRTEGGREPSLQSLSTRSGFTKAHPKAIPEVTIRGRQPLTSRGYQDTNRFFGMRRVRK